MSQSRCLDCGTRFYIPGRRFSSEGPLPNADFLFARDRLNDKSCHHCENLLRQLRAGRLSRIKMRMPEKVYNRLVVRPSFPRRP